MRQKILTLQNLYLEGQKILKACGIAEYQIDAWYLLEYVTGVSKASYYGEPQREIEPEKADAYLRCIEKRGGRIPLQHITGEQEFMGYVFRVNEHVLIPRQDTEVLVEEALKKIEPDMHILDMCTGSGCILLSLMKLKKEKYHVQNLQGTGVDISGEALEVARENAAVLQVDASFIRSDLFEKVEGTYDIIVSNPPYIATEVIQGLQDEVKLHDPYIALDGREDGLHFYRRIVKEGASHLKDGGFLLFEIGYDQAGAVSGILLEEGYGQICVKKDLSGLDRVVCARYYER